MRRYKFDAISGRSKCATAPRGKDRTRIPFSRSRARAPRKGDISGPRVYFCEREPGAISLSLSLSLSPSRFSPLLLLSPRWLQVPLGARLSLSPPAAFNFPNDRLTQCWKLALGGSEGGTRRRKREKKRRRNETHRGRAEAAFYEELYDFPPRARTPPIRGTAERSTRDPVRALKCQHARRERSSSKLSSRVRRRNGR